ncbi:hypothetical protein [Thalassolituus sp.]|uniref:hypothetical protein n=1 Tax=Thalassolituus sp. TaxID=2030822 RepID=UPI002A82A540|nr:hypothetical protein [Thalassolituus sp.]
MSKLTLNIVEAEANGATSFLLTLASKKIIASKGLTSNFILGSLPGIPNDESKIHQNFQENKEFRITLISFINAELVHQNEFINQAKAQESGWIYLIDQRTSTPKDDVPPEDIIGGFQIESGKIVKFIPNKKHLLISNSGVFSLGNSANKLFLKYMEDLTSNPNIES